MITQTRSSLLSKRQIAVLQGAEFGGGLAFAQILIKSPTKLGSRLEPARVLSSRSTSRRGQRLAPFAREQVESVRHRDDAAQKGDGLALQLLGETGPVPALVVRADAPGGAAKEGRGGDEVRAPLRMDLVFARKGALACFRRFRAAP